MLPLLNFLKLPQKKKKALKPKAEVEDNVDLFSFDLDSGVDNIDFLDEPEDNR